MTSPLKRTSRPIRPPFTTDLLILPGGRVLAHNLTPLFAELLKELNPRDGQMARRARRRAHFTHHFSRQ